VTGTAVAILWSGTQSPDVTAIPGGNYKLYFDLQVRHQGAIDWTDLVSKREGSGSEVFTARCVNTSYQFRIRAHAEQPAGQPGASPNQRYPGVWSEPVSVLFHAVPEPSTTPTGTNETFLPLITHSLQC
jgi:hypothetical protein